MDCETGVVTRGLSLVRDSLFDPPIQPREAAAAAPISRLTMADGHLGWLITGHAQVRALLADERLSTRLELHHPITAMPNGDLPPAEPARPGRFANMDGPEHTRLRRMVVGQFTARRVNQLSDWITEIVGERLRAMRRNGSPADLVQEFALPVPTLVICELLGVPYGDRAQFQADSAELLDYQNGLASLMAAIRRLQEYTAELVERKKVEPGDDIISGLIARGEATDDEIRSMSTLLLITGHETTASMLGLGTFALLRHPDQLALLRNDPSLIDNAVEELLRYLSVVQFGVLRTALEDLEFEGHRIAKGDTLCLYLPMANRDPAKFDNPDTLSVMRSATGHLAFGHGAHQCLGHQLARIEMRVGLSALFEQFPDLHLAVPAEEVRLRTMMLVHGVESLPVAWTR